MGISPLEFYDTLVDNGIVFFTGVPDSFLKEFCFCLDDQVSDQNHIVTANEGNAIALASGYHLATGKIPLVYMQNSGLGNAINPLLSLCDENIYSIPMLIIVGWRGEPKTSDEPQHFKQGKIQNKLLKTMSIPYMIISKHDKKFKQKITKAIQKISRDNIPFVIIVKKGTFDDWENRRDVICRFEMTREDSLNVLLRHLPDNSIVVSTTGKTSRELFEIRERNGQGHFKDFLTIGSMGHCSSIALGIALGKPSKKIFCIDGDGALIMHMGSLATIGKISPKNFYHILINNGMHESVGGQATAANTIDVLNLVKSNGYRSFYSAENNQQLLLLIDKFVKNIGPNFLEIKVKSGSRSNLGRPTIMPKESKKDFMRFLKE